MKKILYVEDNEDNVYMLSRRLKRKGFEVIIAGDGVEGIVPVVGVGTDPGCPCAIETAGLGAKPVVKSSRLAAGIGVGAIC